MRQKSGPQESSAEKHVQAIKRQTRRKFSAEEKIRIVLEGLRGEYSIAELCRREGIAQGLYYTWSKEFLEAGKKRLSGDTERQATSGEVTGLKREMRDLKEVVADLTLENRILKKKRDRGWGCPRMRYRASEKLEIIRLVENSHQPVKKTLDQIGVSRPTFYRWYDLYRRFGDAGLEDRRGGSGRVWNRIPKAVRDQVLEMALDQPELSPRELAVTFTDEKRYFVSEASVYRLLKAHDLITSPAFIVMKAASEFRDKTTAPNQLWQTDFTYLKVIGWGWFYLSTVLDDFSRYIIAWKLCAGMATSDVQDTLNLALQASGLGTANVVHRPRLLSDNGPSYISGDLADYLADKGMKHTRGAPYHPQTQGKIERWHQTLKNRILLENYFLPGDLEAQIDAFVGHYNHQRYHESLKNLTPADVYTGRGQTILLEREKIKRRTMKLRRLQHAQSAA
ncbi:MAG: IS3 family transposase [Hyphomonas sp.]|nr:MULTISPECIES: IS3 family transposase [Hyphomonas]MBA4228214.1 IS3 family transposase [Hyphomonas sp.]